MLYRFAILLVFILVSSCVSNLPDRIKAKRPQIPACFIDTNESISFCAYLDEEFTRDAFAHREISPEELLQIERYLSFLESSLNVCYRHPKKCRSFIDKQ